MSRLVALVLVSGLLTLAAGPASAPATASTLADPVHSVTVDGTGVGMFPEFSPGVVRYAVTTTDATGGTVVVEVTTSDPAGEIRINGVPDADGVTTLTGLTEGDEIAVFIADAAGLSRYSLVYLPDGFPTLERVTGDDTLDQLGPGLVLLTMGKYVVPSPFFEAAVDVNGVPAFVRRLEATADLQRQPNGRLSVFRRVDSASEFGNWDLIELDDRFEEVDRHRTVGLANTDAHDAIVQPDGTVWLMAYEDNDVTGKVDAIVQRIDPDRRVGFEWTSEPFVDETLIDPDHPAFGDDYAHINSFQVMQDGNLLVSLRSMSSVYKIATHDQPGFAEGDVIWKLGGRDSDFTFPAGDVGPCAQHTARELPNGNIVMFDNGSANISLELCANPDDLDGPPIARVQTRIVEFDLDEVAGTATPVSTYAPDDWFAVFAGSAQPLGNGNTVIGWGEESLALASEIGPGPEPELLWEIRDPAPEPRYISYRAHRTVVPDGFDPEVTVTTPALGASYVEGQSVTAAYTCSDRGGSSLRTCASGVDHGRPVDTSTPGPHTVTVTATDGAGNSTTTSRSYTVLPAARPDAAVRTTGNPTFLGEDRYGSSADQRVRARIAKPGGRTTVVVRVTNDGALADRLRFRVAGESEWFRVAGRQALGGASPVLAPGESWTFRLVLTRRGTTPPGHRFVLRVPVRSIADPARKDAVSVEVRATGRRY